MALYCALDLVLVFLSTTLWIAHGLETLYPTSDQHTYHCGIDEDCNIMCNGHTSCYNAVFYVFNHMVSIQCIGIDACNTITLISTNVTTLNITATGYASLSTSDIIIDSTNTNVCTICDADTECTGA
eukprot:256164_1